MGVRRVATLQDDLAVKLVDIVGLVVGVAFVKMFPALSRYREHLRQKQVMKWKQKSWRMISTSDISITLRMKMVRKLAVTVKILKIIQLTVILMTSHKLKSSLHTVIQERSGWKGEESMRGWKGGRHQCSSTSSRRCCLGPQAQKCVIYRTEPGVLSEPL